MLEGRGGWNEAPGAIWHSAAPKENGTIKRLLADAMLCSIVLEDPLQAKPWDANGPRTMAEA